MRKQDQDAQVRRAKASLTRIEQQSEKIIGADSTQASNEENDPAVKLGKRIGRGIGYVIASILLWHLITTYLIN